MADDQKTAARSTDEPAQIIANLLAVFGTEWACRNLNCVGLALSWLKANDHPDLWLNDHARHMMDNHQ